MDHHYLDEKKPSGNGSIRSDELLSFGVGNGGNGNGVRTTKNTSYPTGNNGNSSQLEWLPFCEFTNKNSPTFFQSYFIILFFVNFFL